MSRHPSAPASRLPAQASVDTAFANLLHTVHNCIAKLDRKQEASLQFVVSSLVRVGVELKDMAEGVGVSRTTAGRWAQGRNIPRAPAFREWCIMELSNVLIAHAKKYAVTLKPFGAGKQGPTRPTVKRSGSPRGEARPD